MCLRWPIAVLLVVLVTRHTLQSHNETVSGADKDERTNQLIRTATVTRQEAKIAVIVVLGALVVGVGMVWVDGHKSKPGTVSPAESAANDTASASTTSTMAECDDKRVSTLGLYRNPDDEYSFDEYTPGLKPWFALIRNSNYTVERVTIRESEGKRYCMAQLHISGTYEGSSYDGNYYALAF